MNPCRSGRGREPACTESKRMIDFMLKLPDILNLERLAFVEMLKKKKKEVDLSDISS